MRSLLLLLLTCLCAAGIEPSRIAIIYNADVPKSVELAKAYAKARDIPEENLLAITPPDKDTLTRAEYIEHVQTPLRDLITEKNWWTLGRQPDGLVLPTSKEIDVLVTVRGIPFRIARETPEAPPEQVEPAQPQNKANEASVDSELSVLGIQGAPLPGALPNPYFDKDQDFSEANIPYVFLVSRLDGPTYEDCHRLYKDAIEVEKTGLWGLCYLDLSQKYPMGDQWLRTIAATNALLGMPYVIDEHRMTYPANYPMDGAAVYYGWYAHNFNGPFLNPNFKFKKGAVAVHLHSFSAAKLRNAKANWTGPTIAAGAAATVGNVYEPYLHMTHHFDRLHSRLINGYTLVEASAMAMPVLSWQGLTIGDPLYRPFQHFDRITGEVTDADRPFRLIRAATKQFGKDEETYTTKLRTAAGEMQSGDIFESLGLKASRVKDWKVAEAFFGAAEAQFTEPAAKLRQQLHIVDMARRAERVPLAVQKLRTIEPTYADQPGATAIKSLLTILDPPAPPPATPAKN